MSESGTVGGVFPVKGYVFCKFRKNVKTSRILRIPIKHIDSIYRLDSGLSFDSIYSVGIVDNLEVTAKNV